MNWYDETNVSFFITAVIWSPRYLLCVLIGCWLKKHEIPGACYLRHSARAFCRHLKSCRSIYYIENSLFYTFSTVCLWVSRVLSECKFCTFTDLPGAVVRNATKYSTRHLYLTRTSHYFMKWDFLFVVKIQW